MDTLSALQKLKEGVDNRPPAKLYESHKKGKPRTRVHAPLALGFLRFVYDEDGDLTLIAFVLEDDQRARAVGPRLELNNGIVTFIEENGVSGLQWRQGTVSWGHTYEDSVPSKVRQVGLDEWVDDRVQAMSNPGAEVLDSLIAYERERQALPGIAQLLREYTDGDLHDLFAKQVTSREEIDLLADAVLRGLEKKDSHLVWAASHPLGASRVDSAYALARLTDCLEWAIEQRKMSEAESLSFELEEHLHEVDAATLKRLRTLAKQLDNDSLAISLDELK
jgi:hypothetical protein